mgnify:CR=1 FL=1
MVLDDDDNDSDDKGEEQPVLLPVLFFRFFVGDIVDVNADDDAGNKDER